MVRNFTGELTQIFFADFERSLRTRVRPPRW